MECAFPKMYYMKLLWIHYFFRIRIAHLIEVDKARAETMDQR